MNVKNLLFMMGLLIALASCKKEPTTPTPPVDPNNLVITLQDQFTTLPAKVSIFFRVTTKEGDPVSDLTSENFLIYEKGRNDDTERLISRDEAAQQITSNAQVFSYNTLLVLDLSGSVVNNKLQDLKTAAKTFIDEVMPPATDTAFNMTIMWFDGENELHVLAPRSAEKSTLKAAIEGITSNISNDNSTDLYGAVIKGTAEAERLLAETSAVISAASIVIFTDGTDQAARHSRDNAYSAVNNANDLISYYTIGLGAEIDETVLTTLGKNSFAFAENTEVLASKFSEVAGIISKEANSYYLFEYCSPKRDGSGTNELRLSIERGKDKGTVTTTFDAAGFTGGCSL